MLHANYSRATFGDMNTLSSEKLPASVTVTAHEKAEWSRFAQAAYAAGSNSTGHRFSALAALPDGSRMTSSVFDSVQYTYRAWLVFGEMPAA